jgi:4-amino-4-deoxy-L-arabinose transferase-like glycosyltransferase
LLMKRLPASRFRGDPTVLLVGVVILIGVLLRLRGVTWGLPYLYDNDEHFLVDPAVRFVTTGDWNPHSFFYPGSTIMYAIGLAYLVYWIVGHFVGWFPDLQSFATLFSTNPTSFYLIGRIIAIVLATLAIPLTYSLCRRMAGKGAALAAATFVAVSPLHIDFSRVVRTDPLMTTFILAAMLYALKAIHSQSGKDFVLSGAFVGLATATKFPGISGAAIVIMATALASPQSPAPWTARGRWLGLAVLGGVVGFFAATPFVVTGIREVYWSLVVEGSHPHLSATGSRGLGNYLWYLKEPLREAVGWPLELLALVGLAVSCRPRCRARLLLASFSLLFLLGIGLSLKRWDRWIVPLTPCVAILAAIGLETALRALTWLKRRPVLKDVAVVALGAALAIPSAAEAFQRGGTTLDTRDIAKAWIERHVSRGSKVAVEQNTPPISRDEYQVFVVVRGELQRDTTTRGFKGILGDMRSLDPLLRNGIDFLVLSTYVDRFQAEKKSYPDEVRLYEALFEASDLVYELTPTGRTKGPVIRVLKLRQ